MKKTKKSSKKFRTPLYQSLKRIFKRSKEKSHSEEQKAAQSTKQIKEEFRLLGFTKEENRRLSDILDPPEE